MFTLLARYQFFSPEKDDQVGAAAAAAGDVEVITHAAAAAAAVPSEATNAVATKPEPEKTWKAKKNTLQECPICMEMCPEVQRLKVRMRMLLGCLFCMIGLYLFIFKINVLIPW